MFTIGEDKKSNSGGSIVFLKVYECTMFFTIEAGPIFWGRSPPSICSQPRGAQFFGEGGHLFPGEMPLGILDPRSWPGAQHASWAQESHSSTLLQL